MKKILRKIHLWLSVPFGLVIALLCFSGASLLFEREITELCRPALYRVDSVADEPLPLGRLVHIVSRELPDSVQVTGVTVSPDPIHTWQVSLSKPRRAALYVDPYTGEIKGRSERLPFFDTMFHLHRWLLGSSGSKGMAWGKLLTGISTLMMVIILITGLLMWLTNRHRPLSAGLKISAHKGWARFWHDLHVAGGIYATLFLLAVALTGLTWSFDWYRTGFYSLLGVHASPSTHEGTGRSAVTSASDTVPPQGYGHHGERRGHRRCGGGFACWQAVYEQVAAQHPGYRQITLSEGKAEVVPQGRISLRATDTYTFEPASGVLTGCTPYAEKDWATKVRSAVYRIHTGSWGGLFTRILTLLAVVVGFTLPLTGYYLWIRRLGHKRQGPKINT